MSFWFKRHKNSTKEDKEIMNNNNKNKQDGGENNIRRRRFVFNRPISLVADRHSNSISLWKVVTGLYGSHFLAR